MDRRRTVHRYAHRIETSQHVVCTEVARWEGNPEATLANMKEAIPKHGTLVDDSDITIGNVVAAVVAEEIASSVIDSPPDPTPTPDTTPDQTPFDGFDGGTTGGGGAGGDFS